MKHFRLSHIRTNRGKCQLALPKGQAGAVTVDTPQAKTKPFRIER